MILNSTDIRSALRNRQRGFILNPYRFGVPDSYISTPDATPSIGSSFQGGYYAGLIWNQLEQSATSTTIGTGAKVFTVPSMTANPIVYAGQSLEIRSRANIANKMIGTVVGASGTSLTVSVSSVGGSGTFADWSIMAKYRIIVSPKAGENKQKTRNAAAALPTACYTLSEGWVSTLAMVAAGTSTVYPAAWFARGLNISGYTDWYVPSRDELHLFTRSFKPHTGSNDLSARVTAAASSYYVLGADGAQTTPQGGNANTIPIGTNHTSGVPAITSDTAFQNGGGQAITISGNTLLWSSTAYNATTVWATWWNTYFGNTLASNMTNTWVVRAVRRSII